MQRASDCKEEKDMKAAHRIALYFVDVRLFVATSQVEMQKAMTTTGSIHVMFS